MSVGATVKCVCAVRICGRHEWRPYGVKLLLDAGQQRILNNSLRF